MSLIKQWEQFRLMHASVLIAIIIRFQIDLFCLLYCWAKLSKPFVRLIYEHDTSYVFFHWRICLYAAAAAIASSSSLPLDKSIETDNKF